MESAFEKYLKRYGGALSKASGAEIKEAFKEGFYACFCSGDIVLLRDIPCVSIPPVDSEFLKYLIDKMD